MSKPSNQTYTHAYPWIYKGAFKVLRQGVGLILKRKCIKHILQLSLHEYRLRLYGNHGFTLVSIVWKNHKDPLIIYPPPPLHTKEFKTWSNSGPTLICKCRWTPKNLFHASILSCFRWIQARTTSPS